MTQDWTVPGWAALATLSALVLVVAVCVLVTLRSRSAVRRELAELRSLLAGTPASSPAEAPVPDAREYVITHLGEAAEPGPPPVPAPVVPGPLFADLVLRESLVQAGSLVAGLRRALAPDVRNRIRFEMRREVKRSRRQRRADLKQARLEWEARQRQAGPGASAA